MAIEMAQVLMHSPRPVELLEETKQTLLIETESLELPKCHERIRCLLTELVDVMRSPDCTNGQGYLSNAEGNIRAYLALFE